MSARLEEVLHAPNKNPRGGEFINMRCFIVTAVRVAPSHVSWHFSL
jgi:hypothetical protein